MAPDSEELTARKVVGFMSDNHIDPDITVEVFILEPLASEESHRPSSHSDAAPESGAPDSTAG
jgi:hypothetical protein